MKLRELQTRMAADVMRAPGRVRAVDYTSAERLHIYHRQYWFRLLDALAEDFAGLSALLGKRAFRKLAVAYLAECPSRSFTLRDLGQDLAGWLAAHPGAARERHAAAIDMARLEWAQVESFDSAEAEPVAEAAERLGLQPHVRLLELEYPVDRWRGKRVRVVRPEKSWVATHRVEGSVYYRRLEAGEFAVLQRIAAGQSLARAVRGADPEAVGRWFRGWGEMGWLVRRD